MVLRGVRSVSGLVAAMCLGAGSALADCPLVTWWDGAKATPVGDGSASLRAFSVQGRDVWGVGDGAVYQMERDGWAVRSVPGATSVWVTGEHVFVGGRVPRLGTRAGNRWVFQPLRLPPGDFAATGLANEAWLYSRKAVYRWLRGTLSEVAVDFEVDALVVRGPDDVWALATDTSGAQFLALWNGSFWSPMLRPQELRPIQLLGGPTPWLIEEADSGAMFVSFFDGLHWVDSHWGERGNLKSASVWAPKVGRAVLAAQVAGAARAFEWKGTRWAELPPAVNAALVAGDSEAALLAPCAVWNSSVGAKVESLPSPPVLLQRPPEAPARGGVVGGLSQSQLMEVVLAHKEDIAKCANEQRRQDPENSGKLMMHWEVSPSGVAGHIAVEGEEWRRSSMAHCMAGVIRQWKFPAGERGRVPTNVRFPFKF